MCIFTALMVDGCATTTTTKTSHLPAANPKVILRLHGSNIEGVKLAPALATGYLQQLGATETVTVTTQDRAEEYIQGYLPITQEAVAVEIFAHGSGTSFKDLAARQADIAFSDHSSERNLQFFRLLRQIDLADLAMVQERCLHDEAQPCHIVYFHRNRVRRAARCITSCIFPERLIALERQVRSHAQKF